MNDYNQAENAQAMAAWREDEEKAFAGQCLSAETRAEQHAAHVRVDKNKLQRLAEDSPGMFMGLVDPLSPLSQDVLIQYFMLRRTQAQIGVILEQKHPATHFTLLDAIEEMKGNFKPTRKCFERKRVVIRRGKWLGAEGIPIDEDVLRECFQPANMVV